MLHQSRNLVEAEGTEQLEELHEQVGLETAPATVDPLQQTVATALQQYLNHPDVARKQVLDAIRYVNMPMMFTQLSKLRDSYGAFQQDSNAKGFVDTIGAMALNYGNEVQRGPRGKATKG